MPDSKCKHCGKYIYRVAGSTWRHVETGWTSCLSGNGMHPVNKAEPR